MKNPHILRSYQIGGLFISEQPDGKRISIRQMADAVMFTKEELEAFAGLRFEGLFTEEGDHARL
ncbi:MAG: hypothetical protein RBQ99_07560 [Trichlorobacter sp.]|nr:hypothetical protein [Trichlorobacter sp.]